MIILMGVAGAGKSMQGRLLADEAGYPWLSTGEMFRILITGKRRSEMLEGKLLEDEEVVKVLNSGLNLIDTSKEFVLDGFPRNIAQADWVLDQVSKKRFNLTAVFHLIASDEVVRSRLAQRGRQDDNGDAIAKRFEEYKTATLPIIHHFKQFNIPIFDIDAARQPMEVHRSIMDHLARIKTTKQ